MAQDVASSPRHVDALGPLRRAITRVRGLELLPPSAPLARVVLTAPLVTYVALVSVLGIAIAVITVRWQATAIVFQGNPDLATLAAGSLATFLMALFAVKLTEGMFVWSPSVLVNLGLSVTLGPIGAGAAALAEAIGVARRARNGWFRTLFNVFNHFLSNVSAYEAFHGVTVVAGTSTQALIAAGLAAGVTQHLVNHALLAGVIRASNPAVHMRDVVRNSLGVLPYSIGYGFAAFTFVIMHQHADVGGFMALLAPMILLQGYLILFARRVQVHEAERVAHQKERDELNLKALEASEMERRRIARDLHDGVVQNLAGMAFALSAELSQLKAQTDGDAGQSDLLKLLDDSADETRRAMKDLRTLIIQLSPPTLRREGLQAALLEVLREIKKKGTKTKLDLPPDLRLREDRAALIFRVAQEILRNVAAHAEAKNVVVELVTEEGAAILSIQDDGKGFSEDEAARRRAEGHLGTTAIVELAEEAGGTLTVDSEPGRGTLVVLTLPIG